MGAGRPLPFQPSACESRVFYAAAALLQPDHPDVVATARLLPALACPRSALDVCERGHVHLHCHFHADDELLYLTMLEAWSKHLQDALLAVYGPANPVAVLEHRVTVLPRPPSPQEPV